MSKPSLTHRFFLETWYNKRWWAWLLLPLSWVFTLLAWAFKKYRQRYAVELSVPVVIVGNISVGGTGKTPVLIALTQALVERHLNVGIISRGYGGKAPHYPYVVSPSDTATIVGDEPLLIQRATQAPVVIGSDRVAAAKHLLTQYPDTDVILSDDGLQHYRLGRTVEIAVVDGARGLGNHLCLPAGPLREPASRLSSVDWVLLNSKGEPYVADESSNTEPDMTSRFQPVYLSSVAWHHVRSQQHYPLLPLPWLLCEAGESGNKASNNNASTSATSAQSDTIQGNIIAIAGIGNPQRFFDTLQGIGIDARHYPFDDHYAYSEDDFLSWKDHLILMTEKDAVKCQAFATDNSWSLVVDMQLPETLVDSIAECCRIKNTKNQAK